jgi:hypothetical protein
MTARQGAVAFGSANLLTGALLVLGVFLGLPSRWPPVDLPAATLAGLEVVSGAGLLLDARWSPRLARVASSVALALGLGCVTALGLTASWLRGIYGPVGSGGATILTLVAALVLPYLVVLPLAQILWLGSRSGRREPTGG